MNFEQSEFLGRPALINDKGELFSFIDDEHISFGDVCRNLLGQQAQYGSQYVNPSFADRLPYLAKGLRLVGNPSEYHELGIHPDDVDEFVVRYNIARAYSSGTISKDGQPRPLTAQEMQDMHLYLVGIGAFSTPTTAA